MNLQDYLILLKELKLLSKTKQIETEFLNLKLEATCIFMRFLECFRYFNDESLNLKKIMQPGKKFGKTLGPITVFLILLQALFETYKFFKTAIKVAIAWITYAASLD